MEEEDTRELLLPNWQGSGTMGLTLDQNEEGVYVKQLVQNSPAAKTGVVREGDQIVGATVYFDNMSSGDIEKLLANVGQHTVGLKLQRKGDRSPQPGVTYSHDVFSLKSPDVVLSGDDEEYRRIYTKKIKPRLKSDETLEPETQTRTITVTRKVTAYTVDVTGSKDSKEIDISSPEYKIKIPRHEITEISKTSVESEEGKRVIRIPGIAPSAKSLHTSGEYSVSLPGDSLNVHTTTVRYKGQSGAQFEGESDADSQLSRQASTGMHVPDISVSAPKFESYERKINVKMPRFGADHDIGLRGPNVMGAFEGTGLEVKTPDYDTSTNSAVNIKASQGTTSVTSKIGFQSSSTTVKGAQFDTKNPEGLKNVSSSTQSQFINVTGDIQAPKVNIDSQEKSGRSVKIVLPGEDIKMTKSGSVGPNLDRQFKLSQSSRDGLAATGANVDITPEFEGKVNTSKVNVSGPMGLIGTDTELKMNIPSFKMPTFVSSEANEQIVQGTALAEGKSETRVANVPKISMPNVRIDAKGSSRGMETEIPGIQLDHDLNLDLKSPEVNIAPKGVGIKGSNFSIEGQQGHIQIADEGGIGGRLTMPKFNMPTFSVSESKPEGGINISGPQTDIIREGAMHVKGSNVDFKTPTLNISSQFGNVKGGHLAEPSIGVSLPKISEPDADLTLKGSKELDFSKPKVNITGPTVDTNAINIGEKVEGLKFTVPPVQLPKSETHLKGPTVEGNLKGLNESVKVPEVDFVAPKIDLGTIESKVSMPKFTMPKFGISETKLESPHVDLNLPKRDIIDINAPEVELGSPNVGLDTPDVDIKGKVKGSKFEMPSINLPAISMPHINLKGPQWKGRADGSLPKVEGELEGPNVDIKMPEVDIAGPDLEIESPEGKLKMPKFKLPKFGVSGPNVEGPECDISLPKGDLGLSGPDVDVETPDITLKGSRFKMPSMNINVPKMSKPHVDLSMKGPNIEGELKGPNVGIKAPEVDFEAPDIDIDGKVKGPKFKMPSVSVGKMHMPDFDINLKGSKQEAGVKVPKVDIKAPEVDLNAPEVDLDGKVWGPTFKMPSISAPKIHMPEFDMNLKGPKVDADLKSPQVDIKAPEVDLEAPDLDLDGKVKGSKFKMPSMNINLPKMPDVDLNIKGPKWKSGEADFSTPNLEVDVKGPAMDVKAPEVDIEGPDYKLKGPKIKMPSMPDIDFNLKAPKFKAGADIKAPKIEGDLKGEIACPDLDVRVPEVDLEAPDINLKDAEGKLKMPKFKMPKFGLSGSKVEGNLKGPEIDINAPEVELGIPNVDLEGKGKIKGPKFHMPTFGISGFKTEGPEVKLPEGDIKFRGPQIDTGISVPKIEGELKGPKVDIKAPEVDLDTPDVDIEDVKGPAMDVKAPEVDIEGPDYKLKGPKIKMPSMPDIDFNLKAPKFKAGADIKTPKLEGDLKGEITCPDLDVKVPEVDLEAPDINLKGAEGKLKMPKFKMPKFGLSGSKAEGNLKGPEIDINAPEVELGIPNVDLEGKGKIKGPKFHMPKFGISGFKTEGPEVKLPEGDFKLSGPQIDTGISVPKIEGELKGPKVDIKAPEVDLDTPDVDIEGPKFKAGADTEVGSADFDYEVPTGNVEGPDGKFKMPKFKIPKFGISGPSAEGSSVDVDWSGPKVNLKTPEVEVESPEGKVKGPKIKMPAVNLSMPHVSMPEIDLNVKGPKLKGGIDGPDAKIEAGIKDPKIDIKAPELEVPSASLSAELPEGKVKGSKFKLPSWGFSKPSVSMPDVDLNLKGPKVKGDIDVTAKGEFDISVPNVDIKAPEVDIEGPEGKWKGPNLKMPSMNIDIPKVSMPNFDLNLKGPKVEGDFKGPKVDINVPKFKGDLKGPNIDIEGPGIELGAPDMSVKDAEGKFKMPKFGISGPKVEGLDVDASLPKVDMSGPHVDIKAPEIDIEGPEGKWKGPNLKMPSMNIDIPKVSMPNFDLNLKGPKVEGDLKGPKVDINVPKFKGDLKGPKIDIESPGIELGAPDISVKDAEGKFKMPKFGISGPKVEGLNVDGSLPKVDISGPHVDIKAPEVDIEGPEGKWKGPNLKMPSMNIDIPKVSMPNFDLNLKGPKIEGDFKGPKVDIKVPKLEGDLKGPNIDIEGPGIELGAPDISVKDAEGKFKMPKFKMPKFGMSGPKVEGLDADASLPKGEFDISVPNVDIKAPEIDIEGPEGKWKGPNLKMPSMDIDFPKVTMPNLDLNVKGPKVEGDLKGHKVDIKGPEFKMPKFGMSGPKVEGLDVDTSLPKGKVISGANVDIRAPEIKLEGSDGKIKGSKFKMPPLNLPDVSLPESPKAEVKAPSVDVSCPEVDFDAEGPELNVTGKGKKGKFKMPKIHMSGPKIKGKKGDFDISAPDIDNDINLNAPDVDLNVSGGDAGLKSAKTRKPLFGKIHFPDVEFDIKSPKLKGDGSLQSPKADIKTPDLDIGGEIKMPEADLTASGVSIEGGDVKMKKTAFKLPGFNMSGTKVEVPNADLSLSKGNVDLSGPKIDVATPTLDLDASLQGPSITTSAADITFPKVSASDTDVTFKGPKIEGEFGSSAGIDLPEWTNVKGDLTHSKVEGGLNVKSLDMNLESSAGKITFPRLLMPKFTTSGPELSGREVGVDVDFPSADLQFAKSGQADVNLEESDMKIKKSKIKMPKLNFKSKGKGDAILPDVSMSGSKGDFESSKASLGSAEGGLGSASLEVEKPAKYEFSLFTSKKTRHRSSSLSEEKDESTHSSPSGTLEAEGSLSVEGGKKKGKHSKIKFGTFGGLGSKSKGSYEVTLSDDENVQGSGASLSSHKSRVSSSSSSDSATKA
ncbi:hypothetical protein GDO78_003695, partial [Eleutherodactylus coqui]